MRKQGFAAVGCALIATGSWAGGDRKRESRSHAALWSEAGHRQWEVGTEAVGGVSVFGVTGKVSGGESGSS